jgi:hypothetical protein
MAKKSRHKDLLIRQATVIELHLNNLNSGDRFSLSNLKKRKEVISKTR